MLNRTEVCIAEILEKVNSVFDTELVKHFPEARTGDVFPDVSVGVDLAIEKLVMNWVELNVNTTK